MALRTTGMSSAAGTADNPFGGGGGGSQSTALTLSNQSQPMGGVMLELPNGSKIRVASDADAQLLKSWYQSQQQQSAQSLGGGSMGTLSEGGGTPTTRALRTAADGANALSGFFAGRDFRNKLNDYDDAQETLDRLHDEIRSRPTNDPLTNAQMMRILDAQQELFDAQAAVLETQISAVDIQTGAGVANVVASFTDSSGSRSSGGGSGAGTTIALGAAGVGAALLLSRDSRDRRRRR